MKTQDSSESPLYITQDGGTYLQIYTPESAQEITAILLERAKAIPLHAELLANIKTMNQAIWSPESALVWLRRSIGECNLVAAIVHPTLRSKIAGLPVRAFDAKNFISRRQIPARRGKIYEAKQDYLEERDLRMESVIFAYQDNFVTGAFSWFCRTFPRGVNYSEITLVDGTIPNRTRVYSDLGMLWQIYYQLFATQHGKLFIPPSNLIAETMLDIQSDDNLNGLVVGQTI